MEPVSNSEISAFLRCRRKWMLTYVRELAPLPGTEAVTGTRQLGMRIHQAFEADLKSGGAYGVLHWLGQVYGAEVLALPEGAAEIMKEHELARVMIEGYLEWAAETGINEGIDLIEAESDVQAEMPGMPGVLIRGRLDQVIRRQSDGVVMFRDWKTVGSLSQANALILSPQMRFYAMLHRIAHPDRAARVEGGQVVFLARSKRTARATPPFYCAEEVRYNRHDLNSMYLRTKSVLHQMISVRRRLENGAAHQEVAYATPADSCSWSCPFVNMCPIMDDGSRWEDMAETEFARESPYAYYDRKTPGTVTSTEK